MYRRNSLSALAALALVAGCKGAAPEQTAAAAETASCTLEQVARSPEDAELSNVYGLDVDSEGRIYAIASPTIAVFSPDGKLLRRMGKEGSGPGEFKHIMDLQVLPGDSVWAFDSEQSRITVFAPNSDEVAYTTSLLARSHKSPPNRVRALPGERVLFAVHQRPADARGVDRGDQVVRLLNWDGSVRKDSVMTFPAPGYVLYAREGGSLTAGYYPFGTPNLLRLGRDGRVYYGPGDSLGVQTYSLEGRRLAAFTEASYQAPEVSDADMADAEKEMMGNDMLVRALRKQAPERWPAFQNFTVDDRGRVWVALKGPKDQPTRWVLFDQGKRVCSFSFPEKVAPEAFRGATVYGVARDELDVPSVVVYRLSETPTQVAAR